MIQDVSEDSPKSPPNPHGSTDLAWFALISRKGLLAESHFSSQRYAQHAGTDLCQMARCLKGISKARNDALFKMTFSGQADISNKF